MILKIEAGSDLQKNVPNVDVSMLLGSIAGAHWRLYHKNRKKTISCEVMTDPKIEKMHSLLITAMSDMKLIDQSLTDSVSASSLRYVTLCLL